MVKQKNNSFSWYSPVLSFYNFKVFERKMNTGSLLIYFLIGVLILSALAALRSYVDFYYQYSELESFFYTFVLVPLFLLIIYSIFHIFLNSYEKTGKKFWESYLVFSVVLVNFFILANILAIITIAVNSVIFSLISGIIIFAILIYLIIAFIANLKNYNKVSGHRIAASLMQCIFLIVVFVLIESMALGSL